MITLFLIKYLDFLEPPVPPYFFFKPSGIHLLKTLVQVINEKELVFCRYLDDSHILFSDIMLPDVVYNISDFRFFQLPTTNLALPAKRISCLMCEIYQHFMNLKY